MGYQTPVGEGGMTFRTEQGDGREMYRALMDTLTLKFVPSGRVHCWSCRIPRNIKTNEPGTDGLMTLGSFGGMGGVGSGGFGGYWWWYSSGGLGEIGGMSSGDWVVITGGMSSGGLGGNIKWVE
ncbi:hypothetical protein TNCT_521151 [Trichonephila clavata]|uniref:Uncharacterized protein n=1 Tax=Trichonephila clavata TaxID=2740835 RepID=A0A8X6K5X9_TRICU|nr:hypothetical protein TNCT_521151 [Trichonephila clavata]